MLAYVSITLFLRIISVSHGAGGSCALCFLFFAALTRTSRVDPSNLVVRHGIRNNRTYSSEKKETCRSGKRNSIVDSRHARVPLVASPRRQSFVFFTHFTATVRHSEVPPAPALLWAHSLLTRFVEARGRGGSLIYPPLFQKGGHVYLLWVIGTPLGREPNE